MNDDPTVVDPDDPRDEPLPAPKRRLRRSTLLIAGGAAVVLVGGGVALATTSAGAAASNPPGYGRGPGYGGGGPAGGNGATPPAHTPHLAGTVKSVSGSTILITDMDGFTRTIKVSSSTTYADSLTANPATGTKIAAEGTVDATSVHAPKGPGGQGAPGAGGPDGGRPPAGARPSESPSSAATK